MCAKLLEGKPIAAKIKENIKSEISGLAKKPVLVSIQIGENSASEIYLKAQERNAASLGIEFNPYKLKPDITQKELIAYLEKLNQDKSVNGIIIQLPVPSQIDSKEISIFIDPRKDVEGMHPENVGQALFGNMRIGSCTALAVMELIKSTAVDLYGKEAVIVGHSEIVGKPVSLLLLDKFATTTVCHIGTAEAGKLAEHVKSAEILVVAVGKAGLVKGAWIKEGAIVIDVGINRVQGRIVGDVEFPEAAKRASFITPVPGGVGPLTVTMLMKNLIEAYKLQNKR